MLKATPKQITIITIIAMTPLFIFFLWNAIHLTPRQEIVLRIDSNSQQWEELQVQIEEMQAKQAELKAENDELRSSEVFTIAE